MKLKSLTIQGFKSFAEKTEILLEDGITAIVGPNGSGKSNIADAVRWALGEQSAKQLRGGKMEDVIFGGTEKRKALPFCEVSLLFDNEDRALAMDTAEVLVTRRVYRSGESLYVLNRANCRLKDIVELFRDTGVGKEGYSLIGQGRIDEILSPRSEERREVFEEAVGIVTYRARKDEAERRMQHTQDNLDRVHDILQEIEEQMEPLAQQAEDAKQYLQLSATLKGLELNAFLVRYDTLTKRIAQFTTLMQTLAEVQGDLAPQIAEALRERDRLTAELELLDEREREESRVVLDAVRQLEATKGRVRLLEERLQAFERAEARAQALQLEDEARQEAIQALLLENAHQQSALQARFQTEQAGFSSSETLLQQAVTSVEQAESQLETHKQSIIRAMNRKSDQQTTEARLTALRQGFASRREDAETRAAQLAAEAQERHAVFKASKDALCEAEHTSKTLEADAHALDDTAKATAAEAETQRQRHQQAVGERHTAASRLQVLEEMARDYEGYQHAVKQVLRATRGDGTIHGVVATLLKTPKPLERALEMVLGGALEHIVTDNEEAAQRQIEWLRQHRFGRATFLPLTAIRGRTLTRDEREVLQMPGCVGLASELVSFDERYRAVVENLLGRTVIAENLDAGIPIMRRGRHAFRLVTLDGDVINSSGSMTGGSAQSRMTSLLSREREIDEHRKKVQSLDSEILSILQTMKRTDAALQEVKRQRNQLFDKVHQAEIHIARAQEQASGAEAAAHAVELESQESEELVMRIRENLADLEQQLSALQKVQTDTDDTPENLEKQTAALSKSLQNAREAEADAREQATARRLSLQAAKQALAVLETEKHRLEGEDVTQRKQSDRRTDEQLAQQATLESDRVALLSGQQDESLQTERLDVLREQQTAIAKRRQQTGHALRDHTQLIDRLSADQTSGTDKQHKAEVQLVRAQGDLTALQERIWAEYALTHAGALPYRVEGFVLGDADREIQASRTQIRKMGTVNVNAIEDYQTLKGRRDSLSAQEADLNTAMGDLAGIVRQLLSKMEKRFREQFSLLNQHFGEAFTQLFGGGQARLTLSDERDALGSNIDIVAQPPGKKLQLLSLLSGGERALTAIAILFAMLKLKPTPFCVLDEIEAALDEANVVHFADYLGEFSKRTQFVVVTHRRGTMERCGTLYGVAMEEKGVSRMVSMRLTDVEGA